MNDGLMETTKDTTRCGLSEEVKWLHPRGPT